MYTYIYICVCINLHLSILIVMLVIVYMHIHCNFIEAGRPDPASKSRARSQLMFSILGGREEVGDPMTLAVSGARFINDQGDAFVSGLEAPLMHLDTVLPVY